MHFWKIDQLKSEMRVGPVPAHQVLAYALAFFTLWILGTMLPPDTTKEVDIPNLTPLRWSVFAINVVGLYLAYQANGGRSGPDLAGRLLALMWVTSVRLFVFMGTGALLLLLVYIAMVFGGSRDPLTSPGALPWMLGIMGIVPQVLLYWRLVHHIGTIDDAPLDTSTAAA